MHSVRLQAKLVIVACTAFLASCSLLPKKQAATPPAVKASVLHQQHMQKIDAIKAFTINGRLAVITKPKNHSGRIKWQHEAESDYLNVYTPLGGKVASIEKTPQQVTLIDRKNQTLTAPDIASLTQKALGFSLPLSGLQSWALGKPSNTDLTNAVLWDQYGHVTSIQQSGWDIQYKNYSEFDGYMLPKKVFMKNKTLTLKLIIDQWSDLSNPNPEQQHD